MKTHDVNFKKDRTRGQRFEGVILFLDPNLVPSGIEALAAAGCKFIPDPTMVDPCGPTIFGSVVGMSERSENELWRWLQDIIRRYNGDICELGFDVETEKCKAYQVSWLH
jgi:hypothetical protein